MSASNWANCPRCLKQAREKLAAERDEIMAAYGEIPAEDFHARMAALKDPYPSDFATFREDYEIHGASQGVVHVDYGGGCEACGLRLNFNEAHDLPVSEPADA
jgi:hypothetical protein